MNLLLPLFLWFCSLFFSLLALRWGLTGLANCASSFVAEAISASCQDGDYESLFEGFGFFFNVLIFTK